MKNKIKIEKELSKIVEVEWLDINDVNKWMDKKEIEKAQPAVCFSIGYMYSNTDEVLKMVTSYSSDPEEPYGDVIIIPKGCIKHIRVIKNKQ